jgi:phospholipase A1
MTPDAELSLGRRSAAGLQRSTGGKGAGPGSSIGGFGAEPHARANRKPYVLGVLALAALASPARAADPAVECARLDDDRQRLACYDRLFRAPASAPATTTESPSAPASAAAVPAAPVQVQSMPTSVMSKMWELSRAEKRGTFVIRTYHPNYLLPVHYTSDINRSPSSPTHPAPEAKSNYRQFEAKVQVSLRAKVAQSLLLPDADLWFAYTQRSLWQVWDREDSSPFRSTDYEPEVIYVVPIREESGALPGGWQWRMLQLGFAHHSNGQSEPLSRSWNRGYVGVALERGEVGLQLRANYRLGERGIDDNPDLPHYVGRAEVRANWFPGLATVWLTWRTNFNSLNTGALQLDWTYPVSTDQPEGLRWYVQVFTGYGETLLDYNHRQTRVGVGLTLFQF